MAYFSTVLMIIYQILAHFIGEIKENYIEFLDGPMILREFDV